MPMNNDSFDHRSYSVSGEGRRPAVPGLPSRHASYSASMSTYRPPAHRTASLSSNPHHSQSNNQPSELLIELDAVDCNGNARELQHQSSGGNCRFALPPASLMKSLESTTSSSILHGIVLICIMVSSLISFVLSLITDICDDHFNFNCSNNSLLAYSLASMTSCLFCFVIYFLHLIGQCDYVSWSAKRKIITEIIGTIFMLIIITISVFNVLLYTPGFDLASSKYFNIFRSRISSVKSVGISNKHNLHSALHSYSGTLQAAIISSCTTILCYILRILSLVRESRMLANRPSRASNTTTPRASFKVLGPVNELTNRVTNSIRSFRSSVKSASESTSPSAPN